MPSSGCLMISVACRPDFAASTEFTQAWNAISHSWTWYVSSWGMGKGFGRPAMTETILPLHEQKNTRTFSYMMQESSMDVHWWSIDIHRYWKDIQGLSMDSHGLSMGTHEKAMDVQRNCMEIQNNPWVSMDIHDGAWVGVQWVTFFNDQPNFSRQLWGTLVAIEDDL